MVLLSAALSGVAQTVSSPDGNVTLTFQLDGEGTPCYSVDYKGKPVVRNSELGFKTRQTDGFERGFTLKHTDYSRERSSWAPVWGENDSIRDWHNGMTVSLDNRKAKTKLDIEFRVFDDGIGFRYIFPKQHLKNLTVTDELTQFAMPGDMTAWWIPGDYDTQEYEYTRSRLSEIREKNGVNTENVAQQTFSPTGVQTSLMLKSDDGLYVNLHEAALVDFPAMHLNLDDSNYTFTSWLTPDINGNKAEIKLPFSTPWGAVMVSDSPPT